MRELVQTYIAPEMEVVLIEVEQSVMAGSIENLGQTKPDIEW